MEPEAKVPVLQWQETENTPVLLGEPVRVIVTSPLVPGVQLATVLGQQFLFGSIETLRALLDATAEAVVLYVPPVKPPLAPGVEGAAP